MKKKLVYITKYYHPNEHCKKQKNYTDLNLVQDIKIEDDRITLYTDQNSIELTNTLETMEFLMGFFDLVEIIDYIEPTKETEK